MTNHEWCMKHDKEYREAWKENARNLLELLYGICTTKTACVYCYLKYLPPGAE